MTTAPSRNPAFDAALISYLPGLRKRAEYFTRNAARAEELVQDTIVAMLEKPEQCRLETFKTWAQIVMLRVASSQKLAAGAECRTPRPYGYRASPAPQEDHVALRQVVGKLHRMPHGDIVLRHAMGDDLKAIGDERGVTRGDISQKYRRTLRLLRLRTGQRAERRAA